MADDKKNIPDAGKIDNPPELGKVEQAAPPVQDQPAPAKAEAPVVEDASPVVTPPAAEQPAPAGKEAPKDKDTPAPSKEGTPQPGKDEKQATIPGMGDPAPAGKVVDTKPTFSAWWTRPICWPLWRRPGRNCPSVPVPKSAWPGRSIWTARYAPPI